MLSGKGVGSFGFLKPTLWANLGASVRYAGFIVQEKRSGIGAKNGEPLEHLSDGPILPIIAASIMTSFVTIYIHNHSHYLTFLQHAVRG